MDVWIFRNPFNDQPDYLANSLPPIHQDRKIVLQFSEIYTRCFKRGREFYGLAGLLLGLLLFPFILNAQNAELNLKNAGDYNNYMMREMAATVQKNLEYILFSVQSEDFDQLETKRKAVIDGILLAINHITQMPPLDGDTRLRDEALAVLQEYKNAFETDYQKIILLNRKSKDSYEAMVAYFEALDKGIARLNLATKKLQKSQQLFAEKNNLSVVDSKSNDALDEKMTKVIAVDNYWRAIFLDYFKVSSEYDKLWEALPNQKSGPIEKQRLRVLKIIDQVLPGIKLMPDFNGDTEFRDQTINIIEYFQVAASKDFKRIVEVLGQKDVDQKNVEEINGIISKCNSDYEHLSYNWHIAWQDLVQKIRVNPDPLILSLFYPQIGYMHE